MGISPSYYISLVNDSCWMSALSFTGEETAVLENFGQPHLSRGRNEG